MTESEALKDIKENILPCVGGKSLVVAINALENQEKIKDLLDSCTAYPDDMCDCLVEIEKILRSDEEWDWLMRTNW